jgi:hypothetical protein
MVFLELVQCSHWALARSEDLVSLDLQLVEMESKKLGKAVIWVTFLTLIGKQIVAEATALFLTVETE